VEPTNTEGNCTWHTNNIQQRLGIVVHTCNSIFWRGGDRRITSSRPPQAKLPRPHLKNQNTNKKAGNVYYIYVNG
jgi:hypothetical protein